MKYFLTIFVFVILCGCTAATKTQILKNPNAPAYSGHIQTLPPNIIIEYKSLEKTRFDGHVDVVHNSVGSHIYMSGYNRVSEVEGNYGPNSVQRNTSDSQVCRRATVNGNWEIRPQYQANVKEARRRGLNCGVGSSPRGVASAINLLAITWVIDSFSIKSNQSNSLQDKNFVGNFMVRALVNQQGELIEFTFGGDIEKFREKMGSEMLIEVRKSFSSAINKFPPGPLTTSTKVINNSNGMTLIRNPVGLVSVDGRSGVLFNNKIKTTCCGESEVGYSIYSRENGWPIKEKFMITATQNRSQTSVSGGFDYYQK
ncbi:MAG: hypothetical protein HOJ20_11300 [Rhodospirillaceae bacterium]|jgi:hypothetical protein|nr:hypothetical protein [Rhodospirillales bacterium]MBT6310417.1 hypothetical protein [Rhodospirillaceae bacterium]